MLQDQIWDMMKKANERGISCNIKVLPNSGVSVTLNGSTNKDRIENTHTETKN